MRKANTEAFLAIIGLPVILGIIMSIPYFLMMASNISCGLSEPTYDSIAKQIIKTNINSEFVNGKFKYNIQNYNVVYNTENSIYDNNTYLLIKLKVTNISSAPERISSSLFLLLDNKLHKKEHAEYVFLNKYSFLTSQLIPPQKSQRGYIIFKVPSKYDQYTLAILDDEYNFFKPEKAFIVILKSQHTNPTLHIILLIIIIYFNYERIKRYKLFIYNKIIEFITR